MALQGSQNLKTLQPTLQGLIRPSIAPFIIITENVEILTYFRKCNMIAQPGKWSKICSTSEGIFGIQGTKLIIISTIF